MTIGFINGEFVPVEKNVIPIDERGHQFGDGIYEVIRVYGGVPFTLDEHLQRLKNSANAIQLNLTYTLEQLKEIIYEGIKRSKVEEAEVYLQITRGIAPRKHNFPDKPSSTTMTIRPVRPIDESLREKGANAILLEDERWKNCYIKSLNLLPNVLAKQEAVNRDCLEAIFVDSGNITEGSSSNVFIAKGGKLSTPSLSRKILAGITRDAIIKLAKQLGIQVIETEISQEELLDADEVFITSTILEVMPIITIDGKKVADGIPGTITSRLYKEYVQLYKK
jgi:D-alanine transaminase